MKIKQEILCLLAAMGIACGDPAQKPTVPPTKETPTAPATTKRIEAGKNVWIEILPSGERRVVVSGEVSFREGKLEMLMCRKLTKEHESIIAGDFDARDIHKALLAAGAIAGSPVKFEPKYVAASGTPIKVLIRYEKDKKETTVNAREWIRESNTQKALSIDWVFAGSFTYPNRDDPKMPDRYAANSGDVICVSNFGTAMLDLPVPSSAEAADLRYEAFTDRIPELGTKVTVILEPQTVMKDRTK